MKRKRIIGLLTAGAQNLTGSDRWANRTWENYSRMERAAGREPKMPTDGPKWLRIENRDDGEPEIAIYGTITPYPWMDGDKSSAEIYEELKAIDAPRIHLRINSGGGSIFEAVAMYNLFKEKSAEIIVHIDGLAGSSAGWLAMCGDEIIAGEGTKLMIHRATLGTYGNAEELRKDADVLQRLEDSILKIFAKRTGKDVAELRTMMDEETWLDAEEAVEQGFADRVAREEEEEEPAPPAGGNNESKPPGELSEGDEKNNARLKLAAMRLRLRERQLQS